MFLYFSMAFAVIANVFYHLCQKSIAHNIDPLISLLVTYIVALISTILLIILPFFPLKHGFIISLKEMNWASVALGFAIVGIEIGFLLVYRSGWKISLAAPISNTLTIALLLPIGLIFFHDHFTIVKALGLILCIIGVYLISK